MATAQTNMIQLFGRNDRPYGFTYGQWTIKWWEWIMSIPREKSPLHDETGSLWNTNQPSSGVWFLIGNYAAEVKSCITFPKRKIKMDAGRSVLFPVLNCLATSLEYEDLKKQEDLLRHVNNDVNSIIKKQLFINNTQFAPTRISSDPKIAKLKILEDNAFSIKNSGTTDAAADGYWAFIKKLDRGYYLLEFEGSCENGRLSAGASYELTVV